VIDLLHVVDAGEHHRCVEFAAENVDRLRDAGLSDGAETGTLVMASGPDNPTTLNFLPDTHIVVVDAKDIAGDYETVWARVREKFGIEALPRAINLITGPSRSADIAQILILGAHGPRRLHVLIVGDGT